MGIHYFSTLHLPPNCVQLQTTLLFFEIRIGRNPSPVHHINNEKSAIHFLYETVCLLHCDRDTLL